MAAVFGTCGHLLTPDDGEFGITLTIEEYDCECNRVSSYIVVCRNCAEWYEGEGLVIHNEQEELDWWHGQEVIDYDADREP